MRLRVLLVDDHDDARVTLQRRLRRDERLELVGAARTAEEAVALLPEARPDIVLLDIHGHNGRGIDACRRLRRLTDAPVVIFTSFLTEELWAAARDAGATDYLLKEIGTGRLRRELAGLVERHKAKLAI